MGNIEIQIENARTSLLDLTRRNRLLNFRPTKGRTLRIVDEIPREIYDILVIKERVMEFLPKKKNGINNDSISYTQSDFSVPSVEDAEPEDDLDSPIWKVPPPDEDLAKKHTDKYLQTNIESEALQKKLFYIYQESNSILEEQGYTVLYLALGFLKWSESPQSNDTRRAPLLLIPVELERQSVKSRFKIRWTGEEIITNISLQEKLKEQSILLPDFEMAEVKDEIVSYFNSVNEAISSMPNWKIVQDMYLGFFSFTKFVMWKDLDLKSWSENTSVDDYPLINAILNPSNNFSDSDSGFSEDVIDQKLLSSSTYNVMDADPSQICVIENVKQGRNLVVEGPPGTGKSQTITNIIAELLVMGKSVLFISEKMAALEVVKSRLDSIGLGEFCLELHSRKSNKKEVLKEIESTINSPSQIKQLNEDDYQQLDLIKTDLNEFARSLKDEVGNSSLSVYKLYDLHEKARQYFENSDNNLPNIVFDNPSQISKNQIEEGEKALNDLKDISNLVKPIKLNPWIGCAPTSITLADEKEIRLLIQSCMQNLDDILASVRILSDKCGTVDPKSINDLNQVLTASRVVSDSEQIDQNVLLNDDWNEPGEKVTNIISTVKSFQYDREEISKLFIANAQEENITELISEYEVESKKFLKFLPFTRYRKLRSKIHTLYLDTPPEDQDTIFSNLKFLNEFIEKRNHIGTLKESGESLFGSNWLGEDSNTDRLNEFSEWIVSYRKQIMDNVITERSAELIISGIDREKIRSEITQLEGYLTDFNLNFDNLTKKIEADVTAVFGDEIKSVPISEIAAQLENWHSSISKLLHWSEYIRRKNNVVNSAASPLIEHIENDSIDSEDFVPCYMLNLSNNLIELAFRNSPPLSKFIGDLHEIKINGFSELDKRLISNNRIRVRNELLKYRPQISNGASRGSEAGILLGEFNRKRGHMPIRKLLILCGSLIRKIKPCFMMSPLSIAQFLDHKNRKFDTIIFDEASQVKPEDALGSMLRGNQLVVMGDSQQLPPTSFFDHMIEKEQDDYEEEGAGLTDMESILGQCKTSLTTNILKWHYRSKHESLIAVSNQEFYDNQLLFYPSPINDPEYLGLKHVYIPGSVYDRGKSRTNRQEAKHVAQACVEHYRKFPNKSLGVGTFSVAQQQAILEEIELQLRNNPDMELHFDSDQEEHFFVKNLETIQGDERDVIFLSIGYGKDINGILRKSFGPLNREGGYRRLNVIITRARERCVVFSNFKANEMGVDQNSVEGLKALHTFLDFAESGELRSLPSIGEDADSPFEESVYEFLRDYGHEVHKQIGCAGFRVDMGVVDPNKPGNYLLGIECDGAKYHSSPVARDRDRLRQQILESKGWKIYRIWSTDWYRNRANAKARLLSAVSEIKENYEKETNNYEYFEEMINPSEQNKVVQYPVESTSTELVNPPNLDMFNPVVEETNVDDVIEYHRCMNLGIPIQGELHEQPIDNLKTAVINVVDVEGPIHIDEVVRRIRTLWGLEKAGRRINEAVRAASQKAVSNREIVKYNNFLWPLNLDIPKVRKRTNDPKPKIDLISEEEISEAIKLVLKKQFASMMEDLIIQTSRIFGFQATRSETYSKIESIIKNMISNGVLEEKQNGMIDMK